MASHSAYDEYEDERHHRHRHHTDRRDDREPRYVTTEETYVRAPVSPGYAMQQTEIIRRPVREDSDISVEEVRREFPPSEAAMYASERGLRSRSADRYYAAGYYDNQRRGRTGEKYAEPRRRSLSRNQKIIAAVSGAALAVGGKELYDRQTSKGKPLKRNPYQSAAAGAAGAFAAYEGAELYAKHGNEAKEKMKHYTSGRDREDGYYSSDDQAERPKRSKSRTKSLIEGAMGLAGLSAAAKAATSSHDGRRSRRGSNDTYDSRRRSKSRGRAASPEGVAKLQQAAKAALLAGATEAFRVRKEPGGWGGPKGKRIITAAIGAGGIDAMADRDPDHKSKRHILEAVVGGLAGNRALNGSRRSVEDEYDGRSTRGSRSRSRSRGPGGGGGGSGLASLATAGLGALAGKKLLDRSRSRSRGGGGDRRRRRSYDDYDSRSPSPRRGDRRDRDRDRGDRDRDRPRSRSRSVTDFARKGLAAMGIGEVAAHEADRQKSSRNRDLDDKYARSSRGSDRYDDRSDYGDNRSSNGGSRRSNKDSRRAKDGKRNKRIAEGKESASDSESSLGSSTDDEKKVKKMKGKQVVTAGLATVATIHAAHNVYSSIEKGHARHKAVQEGEMSPEEARKLKAKAMLQDAASIGIAALGLKGAYSEIKEANELRHECNEFCEKKEERHRKRLERQKSNGQGRSQTFPVDGRRTDRYAYSPVYVDANPYGARSVAAPSVGY